jgi:hypothetical protein
MWVRELRIARWENNNKTPCSLGSNLFFSLARLFLQIPGDVSINNELGMANSRFSLVERQRSLREDIDLCFTWERVHGSWIIRASFKGKYVADQGHRRGWLKLISFTLYQSLFSLISIIVHILLHLSNYHLLKNASWINSKLLMKKFTKRISICL